MPTESSWVLRKNYEKPMKKLFVTTVTTSLLMLTSTSCMTSESGSEINSSESVIINDQTESAIADSQTDLLTYDGPAQSIPVSAQYPDTMEVMGIGSGEGVGVFFTFKPQGNALDDAEVSVFLPSGASSMDDLMLMITGPNGLIEGNGWYLDGSRADTASEFSYPWFEMVFDISTDLEQSGHVLIGESSGQPVQIIVLYPAEMADEFWPAANIVLNSLEFDSDLLPVATSE